MNTINHFSISIQALCGDAKQASSRRLQLSDVVINVVSGGRALGARLAAPPEGTKVQHKEGPVACTHSAEGLGMQLELHKCSWVGTVPRRNAGLFVVLRTGLGSLKGCSGMGGQCHYCWALCEVLHHATSPGRWVP